jgi:hypothetical protein
MLAFRVKAVYRGYGDQVLTMLVRAESKPKAEALLRKDGWLVKRVSPATIGDVQELAPAEDLLRKVKAELEWRQSAASRLAQSVEQERQRREAEARNQAEQAASPPQISQGVGSSAKILFGAGGSVVVTERQVYVFDKILDVLTISGTSESTRLQEKVVKHRNPAYGKAGLISGFAAIVCLIVGNCVNNYSQMNAEQTQDYNVGVVLFWMTGLGAMATVVLGLLWDASRRSVLETLYVISLKLPFGKIMQVPFVCATRATNFQNAIHAARQAQLRGPPPQVVEVRHVTAPEPKRLCRYCSTLYGDLERRCPNCAAPAQLESTPSGSSLGRTK